ncbi:hypothetical protein BJV78DRAFT_1151167 [Lactifluus subvellereus]|nr:hypothetical protein BJV78DRAFT_1151167 [Lactifluus subvellereus]
MGGKYHETIKPAKGLRARLAEAMAVAVANEAARRGVEELVPLGTWRLFSEFCACTNRANFSLVARKCGAEPLKRKNVDEVETPAVESRRGRVHPIGGKQRTVWNFADVAIVRKLGTGDRGHSASCSAQKDIEELDYPGGPTGERALICKLLYTLCGPTTVKVLDDAEETLNKSDSREDSATNDIL